ncbi:MAG: orotidine-5'-phosphate decarboxylase [Bifidobacteriaceae bacterium]|jgi:orotidine-5'-phosphate decarboxylase|nr:orotidine-5'-phosphate decarboxylase [Bifidobacteriaceae bacterium]MCI1978863.1 orotidine-5'-phosphate decarboxylase [Bifidobacteriaceae bacterium]
MAEDFMTTTAAGIPFGERLRSVVAHYGPLCVGIHPDEEILAAWGYEVSPDSLERFSMRMLQASLGKVGIVEFPSAFFERFGSPGIAVMERILYAAKKGGFVTILDTSRGGSASSLASFIDVYLEDSSPLAADAVTILPYFGFDSIRPFLRAAVERDRGVFIASIGVSPSAVHLHSAVRQSGVHAGETVAEGIIREAARFNDTTLMEKGVEEGIGSIGLSIGTAVDAQMYEEVSHFPLTSYNGPILSSSYEWDGDRAKSLASLLGHGKDDTGHTAHDGTVVVSVSHSLSTAGPDLKALHDTIESTQNEVRSVVSGSESPVEH